MAKQWYIIHVYSGFEKKVAQSIREQARMKGLEEMIDDVLVPSEAALLEVPPPEVTDVTGTVQLPEGVEMVMPGDNVTMTVELIAPIAMDEGLRFAIREGGRTVGAGVVAKILE